MKHKVGCAAALWLCAAGLFAQETFESEYRKGLLALQQRDVAAARSSLEAASRLAPDHALVWAALAQVYLVGAEPRRANDAASRAAELAPADPAVQHALALFYTQTGEFRKAAECERKFAASTIADLGAVARAAHLQGEAFAADQQWPEAIAEFRKAVAQDSQSEPYVFALGQAQLHMGDFAGALTTFEDARRRFPTSAQIALAYGVAAYGRRRFTDAIDAFLEAVRLAPAVEQPYVFLGRILDQAGERMPAIVAAYAEWEQAEPSNYLPPCLHARALAASGGEPAQVEALLRRSVRLNDRYWESHFELGTLLLKRREWDAAAAELSRSIQLNPRHAQAHFQLARVWDKLGRREQAAAERAEHQRLTAAETGVVPER